MPMSGRTRRRRSTGLFGRGQRLTGPAECDGAGWPDLRLGPAPGLPRLAPGGKCGRRGVEGLMGLLSVRRRPRGVLLAGITAVLTAFPAPPAAAGVGTWTSASL